MFEHEYYGVSINICKHAHVKHAFEHAFARMHMFQPYDAYLHIFFVTRAHVRQDLEVADGVHT